MWIVYVFGGPVILAAIYFGGPTLLLRRRDQVLDPTRKPKDEDAYWAERLRIQTDYYLKPMEQYGQLLLWATTGAFAISYAAIQLLTSAQPQGQFHPYAAGYLLFSWLCLLVSAIAVIMNPYASSRMAVYAKASLTAIHKGDDALATNKKLDSEAWGRLTRWLNEGTIICLAAGVWYLGVFVWLNRSLISVPVASPSRSAPLSPPSNVPVVRPSP